MIENVRKTIEKYHMLKSGEQTCVALSGGADSVCLLLVLKKLGYSPFAVHINHHLRGEESDNDMKFCENLCKNLDVKLYVHHVDVKTLSHQTGNSTEMAARQLRYEIFAKYETFAKICTAHNLDDCLETTLFNLTRGTGLKGICGIPPVRGQIVRPLIETTREEIESFLSSQNQGFVTDSTNLETDFSRNKIRHLVLPQLKKINPSLLSSYKKSHENLTEDMAFLEEISEKSFVNAKLSENNTYSLSEILPLHSAVKHRVLGKILEENNIEVSYDKILRLENICENNGTLNVKKDTFFSAKNGVLSVVLTPQEYEKFSQKLESFGEYDFLDRKISFKLIKKATINKNFTKNILDYDKIKGEIFLRNRHDGDKINLCGRNFTSSVKKLFNAKFSPEIRDNRLLLCDDEGLVYVEGFGCADRVKIDASTQNILEIHLDNN